MMSERPIEQTVEVDSADLPPGSAGGCASRGGLVGVELRSEQIVVERRFRGPPASVHGRYACGLVGERVGGLCAAVSLRLPPPVERPVMLRRSGEGKVVLLGGDRQLAEGAAANLQLEVPKPIRRGCGSSRPAPRWSGPRPTRGYVRGDGAVGRIARAGC